MPDAAPAQLPDAWWCATLERTLADLDALPSGLASENARLRLARFGSNRFVDRPTRALWLQYLTHFENPLVLVLLGAAAVNAATGELAGSLIVIALVVASVTLDFVQETPRRAGPPRRCARRSPCSARVVRDGRALEVPVADVVPGDVVLLAAGDLVPADGRVLEARDFFVNEALLTGEAYPVEKHPASSRRCARARRRRERRVHGHVGRSAARRACSCAAPAAARELGEIAEQSARGAPRDGVRDRDAPLRPAHHAAHDRCWCCSCCS